MKGVVYLVGAGPGPLNLLTLRGAELLRQAEKLVYDHLAGTEILNLAPTDCQLIYVGKQSGYHTLSQDEINHLLIREAKAGFRVVRLKGGDPYIFGRGGEEAQKLAQAGVLFEVVPGVSSVIAAAAFAGIPLTHRDFSSQALLMTGHKRPDRAASTHNWTAAAAIDTLAIVMGVASLTQIRQSLLDAGKAEKTPVAIIQWGTTNRQRTLVGTLNNILQKATTENITPPALLVVGEVVNLRQELNWFETKPLFGRRLLITRSREQTSRLSAALVELGAEVWERPTIVIEAIATASTMENTFKTLIDRHWLVFTSPRGVDFFLKALFNSGRDARALANLKIAVIGSGTAEALVPFGLKPDLSAEKFVAEGLLESLKQTGIKGQKIILARANEARDILPRGLTEAGAEVEDLPVYRTVNASWPIPLPDTPDLVILTSSSTAAGLAAMVPSKKRREFKSASIGPITSQTARKLGFQVVVEAKKADLESLIAAVREYFTKG
ncbi:MAG: uroporphyrinogen-III C-methyltransferase [Candidatus Adiutrix intracellularis]|jgi:uroporphyrinogen III methyltransferase/synthase|nr:uroporphyrinogen-III C-methyltransferase [Candidatus Adiutrix intracellularis]